MLNVEGERQLLTGIPKCGQNKLRFYNFYILHLFHCTSIIFFKYTVTIYIFKSIYSCWFNMQRTLSTIYSLKNVTNPSDLVVQLDNV